MSDAGAAFTGTKPVEARHELDEARLLPWLREHVDGFEGPLEVRQFRGGQSNPTYELITPGGRYVLRRKPPGKLLPSAHAVDREFRVISALWPTGFPVARPYALCEDDAVIGTAFYVMEKVEGRIFWDGRLPELGFEERGAVYRAEIETLARLHGIDPQGVGLGDYGKAGNYFARQVDRWSKQYRASETRALPAMDRLIESLPQSLPEDDAVSIVHGDYRLDNLIIDAEAPRVAAVLDWELSTLGNPLADFSYFLMQWVMPAEQRGGLAGMDVKAHGLPTMNEAVEQYAAATGRAGVPELDWYFAYNLFRLAAICQGIAGRVRDGTAASAHAQAMAERVEPLAEAAWSFARKAGA
ncbi:MAG TPA: phosphotransferase family protein [Caulobacteraceae bacterium]|jgi:aminoglycoside phosphotransferase (APT) family kinase protein